MLRDVLVEPHDPSAAAERLAEMQGADCDLRLVAHVEALILRLEELGLVERVVA